MNRKFQVVILVIASLLLVSLFSLLFYRLSEPYLWTDEVFSYLAAQKIVESGKPILDTGLEYNRSPIYHYILAFFLDHLGGSYSENLFASRIPNILAITLTSLITYFFSVDILKSNRKDGKKLQITSYLIALIPVILILSSNFTVALVRETRMYAYAQLSTLMIAYSFYKAIVDNKQSIKLFRINVNVAWSAILILAIIIGIYIQPITLLIGIGVILFLAYHSYTTRNYAYIIIAASALSVIPVAGALLYGTLNPIEIIQFMNPNWGESSSILYYPLLAVRNMPIVMLSAPVLVICLYSAFRSKSRSIVYIFVIVAVYIIIISLLSSKNERYFQPVIPLIYILATTGVHQVYEQFKGLLNKPTISALIIVIIFAVGFHSYLYIKELNEISSHTATSIMQHKKMNFNDISIIIDAELKQHAEVEINADYHSAFTLYTMGYNVKNILIPQNHNENQEKQHDKYIGIPYLYYETNIEDEIKDESIDIVVIRDPQEYIKEHGITDLLIKIYSERPIVFRER